MYDLNSMLGEEKDVQRQIEGERLVLSSILYSVVDRGRCGAEVSQCSGIDRWSCTELEVQLCGSALHCGPRRREPSVVDSLADVKSVQEAWPAGGMGSPDMVGVECGSLASRLPRPP